jgi:hypothetical protein
LNREGTEFTKKTEKKLRVLCVFAVKSLVKSTIQYQRTNLLPLAWARHPHASPETALREACRFYIDACRWRHDILARNCFVCLSRFA